MKNKWKWLLLIVIVVVVGAVFISKNGNHANKNTIVAILPLTGPDSRNGEFSKKAIQMAVEDLGNKVSVRYEDSTGNPKTAISIFNKDVIENGSSLVIAQGSAVAMSLAPIARQNSKILMSLASAPKYSSLNDYTFRISGTSDVEMDSVLKNINDLNIKKLAVFYQNDDYGKGLFDQIKNKYKGSLVSEENFLTDSADMRTQLTKIKVTNPDGIYVAGYSKFVGLIAKQARELGIKSIIICGSACDNSDLISSGGASAEGVIVVAPTPKATGDFVERYKAKYNENPSFISIRMYDAIKVLGNAIDSCSSDSKYEECLKNKIHDLKDFPGVAFPVNFDQYGDLQDKFVTKKVVNGSLEIQ